MNHTTRMLIISEQAIVAADLALQFSRLGYQVIGFYVRLSEAIPAVAKKSPDLLLMDLYDPDWTKAMQQAATIWQRFQLPVIFLSTYPQAVAQLNPPFIILGKPFRMHEIQNAVELINQQRFQSRREHQLKSIDQVSKNIFIRQNEQLISIDPTDILLVKANRSYCDIVTTEAQYKTGVPMKRIAEQLPETQFIKVHRSFLVNANKIESLNLDTSQLKIRNHQVPVSRRQRDQVLGHLKAI